MNTNNMRTVSVSLPEAQILIVEDDENNRFVLTKLLQVEGVPLDQIVALAGDPLAHFGDEAVHFDLVLLDLQMPVKDGFTILAELRADERFSAVPVVAVTANVMRTDVERARLAGFDSFLGKPINGPRLGDRLNRILAGEPVWATG